MRIRSRANEDRKLPLIRSPSPLKSPKKMSGVARRCASLVGAKIMSGAV